MESRYEDLNRERKEEGKKKRGFGMGIDDGFIYEGRWNKRNKRKKIKLMIKNKIILEEQRNKNKNKK